MAFETLSVFTIVTRSKISPCLYLRYKFYILEYHENTKEYKPKQNKNTKVLFQIKGKPRNHRLLYDLLFELFLMLIRLYFPMQKVEKMRVSMSSVVVSPVISPKNRIELCRPIRMISSLIRSSVKRQDVSISRIERRSKSL